MPRTVAGPSAATAASPGSPSTSNNHGNHGSHSSTHNGSTTRGPLSLPLLEGLRCRPGASDLCFNQAIRNYTSAHAIARFVQSKLNEKSGKASPKSKAQSRKRGRRRKSKEPKQKQQQSLPATLAKKQSYHWLIPCLQSPSLAERKAAFGVLCAGCPMERHALWQVLELLANLLQHRGKLATKIPILTLFQHIALECLNPQEQLALWIHPTMGLPWWSDWLWHLSIGLSETNHPCEQQHQADLMSLLMDLMHGIGTNHKLVIKKGDDEGTLPLKYLWKSKEQIKQGSQSKEDASPLAALIGSYHLCKTNPVLKAAIKESSFEHWKQLVDPAFVGGDAGSTSSSNSRTSLKKPERLMDTFADPAIDLAAVSAMLSSPSSTSSRLQGRNSSRLSSPSANSTSNSNAANSNSSFPFSRARRRLEDRSAAATVARIFNAVYGNQENEQEEDDEVSRFLNRNRRQSQETIVEDPPANEEDEGDEEGTKSEEEEEEDDEEIDSDEAEGMEEDRAGSDNEEGEEDEDSDDDDSDDDDDEEEEEAEELSVHGIEAEVLESGLLDFEDIVVDEDPHSLLRSAQRQSSASAASNRANPPPTANPRSLKQKRRVYVVAAMQVLKMQHPALKTLHQQNPPKVSASDARKQGLTVSAEHSLMSSIVNIVQPPKKPPNSKIILRRAPTQEEFFRGSLSKNPVSLSMLRSHENKNEPTIKDLRQHIANDLQMGDSAELLELLCANKILDTDLKLRVVHQVVWKDHLMQNSSSSGGSQSAAALSSFLGGVGRGGRSFISSGAGLSMLFGSGMERSLLGMPSSNSNVNADTPLSGLPPMILTYRLIGVDGEATEDTINTLQDPEAPSESATPEEVERMMEQKFGVTRTIMEGRGVFCLLKSIERNINATLLKIRRDDVTEIGVQARRNVKNPSREVFKSSSPYPGLELLWCCSKLPSNRKLLLQSRAPTMLLRLLLSVLHALEEDGKGGSVSESNATVKALQKSIEVLASDMISSQNDTAMSETEEDNEQDASTLRLLLTAIETSSLSRPLRNVIAKLLPYLTYGQASLCKELANEFMRHVSMDQLGVCETQPDVWDEESRYILPATCVHASCSLPENPVCDSLRVELVNCGFVERLAKVLLDNVPSQPPPWSPSLWTKDVEQSENEKIKLEGKWKEYFARPGLKTAFNMLIGLCKSHGKTQLFIGNVHMDLPGRKKQSLIQVCHWIESTSDSSRVSTHDLGIVAETLLDELTKEEKTVAPIVKSVRRKTRDRKKEIAMARRNKALRGMGSFGPSAMSGAKVGEKAPVRGTAASLLAPVLGLFGANDNDDGPPAKRAKKNPQPAPTAKPAWMTEMENMEDEDGLTCAVCQEGRTLQPAELLGLYAYVKKVSIPMNQSGSKSAIDGTDLLTSLPGSMPRSISDTHAALEWFPPAKKSGDELRSSARSSSLSSSSRKTTYTTTVTAGNAIHFSCHAKARQADKNHPKAPKSEWEGASLRNSRVKCNVMLPLVSSRSSKVPLVAVDSALTDHSTAVSNLLNARPKSMLWTVLHDVRLLLLRIAYGEPLNADCEGGSLSSNSRLVYYQLLMADMFAKDAEIDSPQTARHACSLSGGFLAACTMIKADDYDKRKQTVVNRSIADSSLMAALTCILFHNTTNDYNKSKKSDDNAPNNKRRWVTGKESFLRGLITCAGRRHSLGLEDSGCLPSRNQLNRGSFADWDVDEDDAAMDTDMSPSIHLRRATSGRAGIEDFRNALRPMIVFYAIMDQVSSDFSLNMDDAKVEECGDRLTQVIQDCRRATSIQDLLQKAKVTLDHADIMQELQRGILSA